jgi:ATP-dependent exoDNAse (exonuclease V) beta subunit
MLTEIIPPEIIMQNFIVYKSSAGSGKTYTLVSEYLQIILVDPEKIRNILAITFTNAAAAEMKERIIATLGELAALAGLKTEERPKYSVNLLYDLKESTLLNDSEIIRNARLALTLLLHNYGDFSVSTIDSFAHRVIRSFAFDLKLPVNFDVELDQDQMLAQAIDLLVSRAGEEPALTRLLIDYIESRTDDEQSHFIEYDMARLARTLMDEKGGIYIDQLKNITLDDFSKIHRNLRNSIRNFEESVKSLAGKASDLIEQNQIPIDMFYRGKPGIGTWFANLAKGLIAQKITPNSYVLATIQDDKWTATKASASVANAIDSIKGELTTYFHQIQELANAGLSNYKIHTLVKKHLFPMAVLCELEKVMNEIKSEQSLLHISDFNKKISEIVAVESAPFIYERIGERYHHYMIDEFQDTSGLQWQNLLPLIDNSLASANKNLIVGDGKQAIYRWRNGDVEQFANLPHLPESITAESKKLWEQTLVRNYLPKNLDTNWRSQEKIIDFNNRFFEFAKSYLSPGLAKIYQNQKQKVRPEKAEGYVQIDFLGNIPEENLDYIEHTHQQILETINQLTAKDHPFNDITILCRSNREASAIARFLLENNVKVISSESLLLDQSPKVNFMLSVMRLIVHASDEISRTEIVAFLAKNKTINEPLHDLLTSLKNTYKEKQNNNHPFMQQQGDLEMFENFLQSKGVFFPFSQYRYLGIYELGETIVRSFFTKQTPDPFIAFFMDVLFDYSNHFVSSLPDFLEWWVDNSKKYSVVVPEGTDAVQIMTIHKSKGLQFPVVIFPFVDKDFTKKLGKQGEWVILEDMQETQPLSIAWLTLSGAMEGTPYEELWEKEKGKTLLDMLNVVYVAFTRAVDKLFILSRIPESGKFSDKNLSGLLQKFLETEGLWNNHSNSYTFGQHKACQKSEKSDKSAEEPETILKEYISTSWSAKISIRSRQMETHQDKTTASERGSRIHAIMEKVYTPADLPIVLQQLLLSGQIDKNEMEALEKKILNVINHPKIKDYYQKGLTAKNECGMYNKKGRFYRTDRVILDGNSAVIIDYKTGSPNPEHIRQINQYASIISDMHYTQISKFLVYIDLAVVEEVL